MNESGVSIQVVESIDSGLRHEDEDRGYVAAVGGPDDVLGTAADGFDQGQPAAAVAA
jgi:hypothetical protein